VTSRFSRSHAFGLLSLWLRGHGVNTLGELKARISVAVANITKDRLRRICKEVDCMQNTEAAHSEVFSF
jgi:hypothetical protein